MARSESCGPLRPKVEALLAGRRGKFGVQRDTTLDYVKLRRSYDERLTPEQRSAIDDVLLAVREALTGVEQPTPPSAGTASTKRGFLRKLISPGAALGSDDARKQREWDDMTSAAGGPAALPPPNIVIDVARDFLIAEMSADGRQDELDRLRRSWLAVSVD